jgi:ABC-2 type transport system permease protein
MNIFNFEFRSKWRSAAIWSFSIALIIVVFLSLYPSFASEQALVLEMMRSFPKELLIAFGMADLDWSNVLGYFALAFVFIQVCLAIQAANYGFSLVSVEESELTADFLLTKPVTRPSILTAKLLAALAALVLTNALVWAVTFLAIDLFGGAEEYAAMPLILLLLSMFVFQLFFLTSGMCISLLVKRVRNVTPFSMALVFGLYVLNAFGGMIGEKGLEMLSPFKHFNPGAIIRNAAWDHALVLISVAVIVIATAASYVLYTKRNIAAAV